VQWFNAGHFVSCEWYKGIAVEHQLTDWVFLDDVPRMEKILAEHWVFNKGF
jgi:hypothetical protein